MSWGRNNQSVTANSTTTAETSNGAPMGIWAYTSGAQGACTVSHAVNAHFGNTSPGSRANVDVAMFQNTTPGVFNYNKAIGVFGVTANQMSNNTTSHLPDQPQHSGWVLRRAGTGSMLSAGYTGTATSYSNGDLVTFVTPAAGGANAVYSLTTNSTGGSLTFTTVNVGSGFTSVNNSGTYTNSTSGTGSGTGATFVGTAGGRAGRVHTETLVAMGSILPGSNNAQYANNS